MHHCSGFRRMHANVAHLAIVAYIGLVAWFIRELRTITDAVVDIREAIRRR